MKAGLLPFYISLYSPKLKERLEPFCKEVAQMLTDRGIEIVLSDFCMIKPEFEAAIQKFEEEGCDAVITLHTVYSPSLEYADVLATTHLPVIVCDTTDTFDFSCNQSPSEISYCHGIHGVMDMCNMLKKRGKPYAIAAGHYTESDVIDRTAGFVKAAKSAASLKGSVVGSIGGYFDGMGDFRVDDKVMEERFGAKVIYPAKGEFKDITAAITREEIEAEKQRNLRDFDFLAEPDEAVYENSIITDIALKKWIDKHSLSALTVNFREIGELCTMPFNGACRAMESGIGYAGEGDTLTALFTGAMLKGGYKETSFVEIFCPDWKNNSLFISHMGEINYAVAHKKPEFFEKNFVYGNEDSTNPYTASAAFKPGEAVFVNIFEDEKGFNALIAPVSVKEETSDMFVRNVRGWLDFKRPISDVLEDIGTAGATHHSILIYGARVKEIEFFAKLTDINAIII